MSPLQERHLAEANNCKTYPKCHTSIVLFRLWSIPDRLFPSSSLVTFEMDGEVPGAGVSAASVAKLVSRVSTWRRWTYVYLPVITALVLLVCSSFAFKITLPSRTAMGICTLAMSYGCFKLSTWIYPPKQDATPPASSMPWSHESRLNRLMSNFLYNLVNSRDLSLSSIINDTIRFYGWTFFFGTGLNAGDTPKSQLFWALKHCVIAFLVLLTFPFIFTAQINAFALPIAGYIRAVYTRLSFIAIVDCLLAFLLVPPRSFRRKVAVFAIQTLTIVIICLNVIGYVLTSGVLCPQEAKDLLVTHACYSKLKLNDPFLFQKQKTCRTSTLRYMHETKDEVRQKLFDQASGIATGCATGVSDAAVMACMALNGVGVTGLVEWDGMCLTNSTIFKVAEKCTEKNPDDRFSAMIRTIYSEYLDLTPPKPDLQTEDQEAEEIVNRFLMAFSKDKNGTKIGSILLDV